MANCKSPCLGSINDILRQILDQDIATGVRLTQTVQAFEAANGVPQSNQGTDTGTIPGSVCTASEWTLLSSILLQRQANFDRLQQVLLAV